MITPIRYHSNPGLQDYFYDTAVCQSIQNIRAFLGSEHELHVFPEAAVKKNNAPNGILIQGLQNQTILLPSILRDPGCGFLIFSIDNVLEQQLPELATILLDVCQRLEKTLSNIPPEAIIDGVHCGVDPQIMGSNKTFCQSYFPCDPAPLSGQLDVHMLAADLHQITNSLELKIKTDAEYPALDQGRPIEILGCLHTGSDYLPLAIQKYWFQPIVTQCVHEGLSSVEKIIEIGLYGLYDNSEQAYAYRQWIFAAMNFCLFKRAYLFGVLKNELEKRCHLELTLINDRCHAGLFETTLGDQKYWIQSRGVQLTEAEPQYYLMAGQRESRSYLIKTKHTTQCLPYLGHGTSYRVEEKMKYANLLGRQHVEDSIRQLAHIRANTPLKRHHCLAYEFNVLMQTNYLSQFDVALISLLPFVNYQGQYLRGVSAV